LGVASPAEEVTGEWIAQCAHALESYLHELLAGKDIRRFRLLMRSLEEKMAETPAARAAVDIALHDLRAKQLGLPLVELLGGEGGQRSIPTSITIGIKSLSESVEEAREYEALGFKILKIKIGKTLEEDIERLHRIREEFGRDMIIRVDANQGYTIDELGLFVRKTSELDIELIEQPLKATDLANMQKLPGAIRERMAADESLLRTGEALALACHPQPFGIFNIKLMKCGGIFPGMQIAETARLAGIDVMWGCMDESLVGISAALHAAFASPATKYLDLDGNMDLSRDLVEGGVILDKGRLRLSERPGLGVSIPEQGV